MRVAIVVERFARSGGVEGAAWHLVAELAARGIDTTVVCREAHDGVEGAHVRELRVPRAWQPLRLAAFSRAAARATCEGFDVVHSFSRTRHQHVYRAGGGSHAAYLERTYRFAGLRRTLSPRHLAILRIEEAVFRDSRQLIECNARGAAQEIARRYAVPPERITTIYNGVDSVRFHPARRAERRDVARAELGVHAPAALFLGSGFHRKGLDRAIRALAEARVAATLLVAGRDDPRPYHRLAQELGVDARVRFLGERSDVERLLAAADLLLLPTRYDPFANACLEAMAAGLAVATTPANGVAELIAHEENGLVYEDDFTPALRLLADPERLKALGERARATAEAHSWARHAEETLALYGRVKR